MGQPHSWGTRAGLCFQPFARHDHWRSGCHHCQNIIIIVIWVGFCFITTSSDSCQVFSTALDPADAKGYTSCTKVLVVNLVNLVKFHENNNHFRDIISLLLATLHGGAAPMAGRLLARGSRPPTWSTSWSWWLWWSWSPSWQSWPWRVMTSQHNNFRLSQICANTEGSSKSEKEGTRMIFPGLSFLSSAMISFTRVC